MRRVCPRCGKDGRVEALGVTAGSIWLQCGECGHLWREPGPGLDPFAVILARATLAVPVRDDCPTTGFPRAPRFQVRVAVRYRPDGEEQWRVGLTENISRSGVLFRARDFVSPSRTVDLLLTLPGGEPAAESRIGCRGHVVRAEGPGADGGTMLAAAVDDYRFN